MKKEKLYIKGLDGIRALAILGVTLFHIFPNSIKGGYLGVSLFFVLTGFLLAITSKRDFHLFSYIQKRIVRIYPALLIVIFTTIAILFFLSPNSISGMKQEVLSIVLGYNNIWQIHQNADYFSRISNASPFTHFWYLGIELQYYLIWPILFLIYKMGQKIHKEGLSLSILSILAFLSMILMPLLYREGMDVTSLYYGTHTRIYALLFGSILGFLWTGKKKKVSNSIKVLSLVGTFFILLITMVAYYYLDGQSSILYRGGMIGMTFLFVLLIYLVSHPSLPVGNVFEIAPLKWLGKHSYSIFLWQ
ncbi:MAG: acyltransferase, partial [Firmicutes bacterium]|nr:acyltransferase [Bacillota bacterium]